MLPLAAMLVKAELQLKDWASPEPLRLGLETAAKERSAQCSGALGYPLVSVPQFPYLSK